MERQDEPSPAGDPQPRAVAGDREPPSATDGARGSGREARWCLVALVLAALASLPWLAHGALDPKNDACMYILLARGMLSGEGYSLLGEPFALRPPGFSALIAPLVAAFGTDVGILNLFVNLFGVACVALLFALARPRLGPRLALAVSALVWINPGFRASCNQVMSDVPGLALALLCLVVERVWREAPRAGSARAFGLGVLVGAAALVRTMNVLLVPAFLLAALLRRGRVERPRARSGRRGLLLVLGTAVVLAPWSLRNALTDFPAPTEQTSIHSYGTGMFHVDPGDPASSRLSWREIAGRVPGQVGQIAETLGGRFSDASGPFASPPGPASAFGVLALAAVAFVALRRREPLELAALALFAVVALYFAFVDRLVLPVFVLGLPAAAETACLALGRLTRPHRSGARLAVGAVLLALAALDARHLTDPEPLELRARRMRAVAQALDRRLPPGAPVAARLGWELGVYLEERRVHSLYVVAKRAQRAGMLELLERHGVDHCVFHQPTRDDRTLRKALQGVFRKTDELDEWWLVERRR